MGYMVQGETSCKLNPTLILHPPVRSKPKAGSLLRATTFSNKACFAIWQLEHVEPEVSVAEAANLTFSFKPGCFSGKKGRR